jgi:hypothetical protein
MFMAKGLTCHCRPVFGSHLIQITVSGIQYVIVVSFKSQVYFDSRICVYKREKFTFSLLYFFCNCRELENDVD